MSIITIEHELNRGWIYDEDDNLVGETNFVVSSEWLMNIFNKLNDENKFIRKYKDFEEFEILYEPETDGEIIYRHAINDGVLKEDLGIVMYCEDNND